MTLPHINVQKYKFADKMEPVFQSLFEVDFKFKEEYKCDYIERIIAQFVSYKIKKNIITFVFNDNDDLDLEKVITAMENCVCFEVNQHDKKSKVFRKIVIDLSDDIFLLEYKQSYGSNDICFIKFKLEVKEINVIS